LFVVKLSIAILVIFESANLTFLVIGIRPDGYFVKIVASFLYIAFTFQVAVVPILLTRGCYIYLCMYYRQIQLQSRSNPALN
jgi:hypothetical protein